MFIFAAQPQSIGKLIKDGMRFYKTAFSKVLLLVLSMAVLANGLNPQLWNIDVHQYPHIYLWAFIVSMLLTTCFLCAIYKKMYLLGQQQQEELARIPYKVFPSFLVVFISYIVFLVLLLILGLLILVATTICVAIPALAITWLFSLSHNMMLHEGMIIIGIIAAVLFLLCDAFLWGTFVFYIPLILFDRAGPLDVVGKSIKLVWGNWWRTFAVLFVAFLLTTIILLPFMLLSVHYSPHQLDYIMAYKFYFWSAVVHIIGSLLLIPWMTAIILVLYNDLKLR